MMRYGPYKHIIPIQVRFSDVDRLNHVNNAVYHNYVELGRVTYFNEILGGQINWDEQGFMLARTEMDHLEQVYLNDEVYCCTQMYEFGNKSARVRNLILKKSGDQFIECAAVEGVLVAMDYRLNASIRVPDLWRSLISKYEADQAILR